MIMYLSFNYGFFQFLYCREYRSISTHLKPMSVSIMTAGS